MRLVLACLWLLGLPAFGLTPVERKDIADRIGTILCAGTDSPSALPLALWDRGLSDAQIEGRLLERRFGQEPNLLSAQRKARSIAQMRRYQGYAYGKCHDGRAWALALPAPSPIRRQDTTLHIPVSALTSGCETWRIDYAQNSGGDSIRLEHLTDKIDTKTLAPGILSVSCQPRKPSWQGPVQWFLTPIGAPPSANVPSEEILRTGKNAEKGIIAWINHLRVKLKRAVLVSRIELIHEAGILAIDRSLTHNRKLLRAASSNLSSQNLNFLGENRVKGRNVQEIAWLLWHSPRHRDLLLHKDARLIGITMRKTPQGHLAVIVVGTHDNARIGKRRPIQPREKAAQR